MYWPGSTQVGVGSRKEICPGCSLSALPANALPLLNCFWSLYYQTSILLRAASSSNGPTAGASFSEAALSQRWRWAAKWGEPEVDAPLPSVFSLHAHREHPRRPSLSPRSCPLPAHWRPVVPTLQSPFLSSLTHVLLFKKSPDEARSHFPWEKSPYPREKCIDLAMPLFSP